MKTLDLQAAKRGDFEIVEYVPKNEIMVVFEPGKPSYELRRIR